MYSLFNTRRNGIGMQPFLKGTAGVVVVGFEPYRIMLDDQARSQRVHTATYTSGNLPLTFLDSYEPERACTSEKVEKSTRNLESKKS